MYKDKSKFNQITPINPFFSLNKEYEDNNNNMINEFKICFATGELSSIIEKFNSQKLNINKCDDKGEPLLHLLIKEKNILEIKKLYILKYLIEKKADITIKNNKLQNILHISLSLGLYDIASYLINDASIFKSLNCYDIDGNNYLNSLIDVKPLTDNKDIPFIDFDKQNEIEYNENKNKIIEIIAKLDFLKKKESLYKKRFVNIKKIAEIFDKYFYYVEQEQIIYSKDGTFNIKIDNFKNLFIERVLQDDRILNIMYKNVLKIDINNIDKISNNITINKDIVKEINNSINNEYIDISQENYDTIDVLYKNEIIYYDIIYYDDKESNYNIPILELELLEDEKNIIEIVIMKLKNELINNMYNHFKDEDFINKFKYFDDENNEQYINYIKNFIDILYNNYDKIVDFMKILKFNNIYDINDDYNNFIDNILYNNSIITKILKTDKNNDYIRDIKEIYDFNDVKFMVYGRELKQENYYEQYDKYTIEIYLKYGKYIVNNYSKYLIIQFLEKNKDENLLKEIKDVNKINEIIQFIFGKDGYIYTINKNQKINIENSKKENNCDKKENIYYCNNKYFKNNKVKIINIDNSSNYDKIKKLFNLKLLQNKNFIKNVINHNEHNYNIIYNMFKNNFIDDIKNEITNNNNKDKKKIQDYFNSTKIDIKQMIKSYLDKKCDYDMYMYMIINQYLKNKNKNYKKELINYNKLLKNIKLDYLNLYNKHILIKEFKNYEKVDISDDLKEFKKLFTDDKLDFNIILEVKNKYDNYIKKEIKNIKNEFDKYSKIYIRKKTNKKLLFKPAKQELHLTLERLIHEI